MARGEPAAAHSQDLLFGWNIGINDADNGVFLPAKPNVPLDGHPYATYHHSYHSPEYHLEVFARLSPEQDESGGREALRGIKADLLSGVMSL